MICLKYIGGLVFIAGFLLFPSAGETARMKIKEMDYAVSWKTYMKEDARLEPLKAYPYERCFRDAAQKYDLPLTLLLALARGESDFDPMAEKEKTSCYGIMQIQWPGTAGDLGFKTIQELKNPCENIKAGARYLRMMLDRYDGDLHLAVAAYNYGPGRISRAVAAGSIPQGADWYSGYIYHHLQQVLSHAKPGGTPGKTRPKYRPGMKLPVIVFHNPLRARGFLAYFKERAPDLRLDWFRTSLGETYIAVVSDTEREQETSIRRMKELGYTVGSKEAFP